jgi:predicted nucleic acid-binding protein
MACLDTTAILDLAGRSGRRSRERARRKVDALQTAGEALVTTRFNVAELWVGIYRSDDRAVEIERVEAVLGPLPVLDLDARSAEVFGRVVGALQDVGTEIGDMDALIASVCLVAGHSVLTRNTAHFARVPGLVVETY